MKGERGGEHENKRADLRDATTARPASCASRNSSPPVIDAQTEGKQRQDRRREARKERRTSIPGIVLDEQAALVAGYPQAGGGRGGADVQLQGQRGQRPPSAREHLASYKRRVVRSPAHSGHLLGPLSHPAPFPNPSHPATSGRRSSSRCWPLRYPLRQTNLPLSTARQTEHWYVLC